VQLSVRSESARHLRLAGEVDLFTAPELAAAIDRELLSPGADLTLDVSGLSFIDSHGIRIIVETAQRLEGNGRLVLIHPSDAVSRVMEVTGIRRLPNLIVFDADLRAG